MEAPRNYRKPRTAKPGDPIDAAAPALRHFGTVAAVFLAFCAIPYAHDSMEDYRYLDLIDASPLVRAITFSAPKSTLNTQLSMPAVGEGGTKGLDGDVEGLLPEDPALEGKDVSKKPPRKAAVTPEGKTPKKVAAARPAKKVADPKGRDHPLLRDSTDEEPMVERPASLLLNEDTFAGQKTWIDDPEHLLDPFYKALVELAYNERDKVRVRHYGDSHLANDGITHAIRVMLQRRFGDGGHGFTLVASRTKWYKHKGIRRSANDGWKARNFLGGSLKDKSYGYGGVAALGQMGSKFTAQTSRKGAGTSASFIELWFRGVAMGRMSLYVDGKRHVQKVGKDTGDRWKKWKVPDGKHKFTVKVESGWMRLFGVVFERDKGVVYDSLGVVGARASRWRNASESHLKRQFDRRPTDMLVLSYGGNSRNDRVSKDKYMSRYLRVIERLRIARPNEPCLVMSPTEHGKKTRKGVINDPNTARMIGWQREVAKEAGCAFFDAREWMKEVGDMNKWVKKGYVWHDMAHLTPRGQSKLGQAVYRAYMHGLLSYLDRKGDGLSKGAAPKK